MSEKKDQIEIHRTSELIADRTTKMGVTFVASALCVALATAVDALVAGAFIGTEALAAVAAAAPFLAINGILHCLLGFGIDKLMIQSVARGNRKEADRIFGTVLIAVLVVYLIVVIPAIIYGRGIISANLSDPEMVEPVYQYCWPRFAAMPLLEICLCIERAFRVDGRAKLFSARRIVASLLSILLDFFLVPNVANQVQGLAWAYVIGSLLGYTVSLSHFFSKKRTVTPDFSVICSLSEMWEYIKADIRMGSSATWDEVLATVLVYAQTNAVSLLGGTVGLAVWSVYKALRSIVESIGDGISASVSVHTSLLFGECDYDGVRYSAKKGTDLATWYCIAVSVLVLVFAGPIADLYKIAPDSRELCAQCLRIGCLAYPALAVMTVFTAYLPAIDRNGTADFLTVVQKGLPILAATIGHPSGMQGFVAYYVFAVLTAMIVLVIMYRRDGAWFVPKNNPETIDVYSIQLTPELINAVSSDIKTDLEERSCSKRFSLMAALVAEESLNYILKQNPDANIHADLKMDQHHDDIQFTIIDDGMAYNPISDMREGEYNRFDMMETTIIRGLTMDLIYDRVLDLNLLELYLQTES